MVNVGSNGPECDSTSQYATGWLVWSALPQSGTCVLQKSLWGIWSVNDLHQLVQHHGNVRLHLRS